MLAADALVNSLRTPRVDRLRAKFGAGVFAPLLRLRNMGCVVLYVCYSRHMDTEAAILALAALAQSTRLDVFRLLVRHEPEGLSAGELARDLAVPHNTLSTHLAILSRAGLIKGERHSRSIIYRANLDRLRAMMLFLVKDCCGGRPALCAPLIADLAPCCFPETVARHD